VRVALDTNILAYAEGINDQDRQTRALLLMEALQVSSTIIPVQVLGELFRVLTKKGKQTAVEARTSVLGWQDTFTVASTSSAAFLSAMDLAADHRLQIWDAPILAVAAEANCRLLLSEDLQSDFTWRGVTVVNPFSPFPHPLLDTFLAGAG